MIDEKKLLNEMIDLLAKHCKDMELAGKIVGLISVQPTSDGWIPVSERLPNQEEFLKDDGRVIVTDGCRVYQSCYDIYSRCFRTVKLFNFYEHGRIADFKHDKCVIAWQPLPQPYKESEEE